jgi:hypothetical protein
MPGEDTQLDRVERRLKAMGLQITNIGNGFLVTDMRCNVVAGFVPNMTLDAIDSRINERLRTSDRGEHEPR